MTAVVGIHVGVTDDEVRAAIESWLTESLPSDWPGCGLGPWVDGWRKEFYAGGWAVPGWPIELGGLGLTSAQAAIVNEALAAAAAPVPYNAVTVQMVGAALMSYGTPELQRRLLPEVARGRTTWCQLFSEPGAGSDLASLSCRGLRDGDRWILNGQKVWSSFARIASYGLLLARTNPSVPKREGITAFVVPMKAMGVTVVPLKQMTGDADFCEVFLDDVELDDNYRVGPVDAGWRVATAALSTERGALGGEGSSPVARVGGVDIDDLRPFISDGLRRDRFVQAWIRERVTVLLAERMAKDERGGPLLKVAQAVNNQALQNLATDLVGIEAVAASGPGFAATVGWGFLRCRANTIGGGTSEVLRNTIGERLLGLPREPDPYRGVSWQEIPR
jgi:alkylation response protein AidB-like acyl-CoA dehydrogenase